jgi:glycerol kinase
MDIFFNYQYLYVYVDVFTFNFSVWSDIRTDSTVDQILAKVPENSKNALMPLCGLPISPYFSALKMRWLIDNVPAVRRAIREQRCRFGTVDTWLVWVCNCCRNTEI